MVVETKVRILGLRELQSAFKKVDSDIPKELKTSFLRIATDVAGKAAAKVPHRTGRAASSIRPRASQRGAGIAFGGSAAPYYPWLDFGGRVGRNKSIYRDLVVGGRYIYPTIAEEKDAIEKAAEDAVESAAHSAGFEVRG